MIDSNKNIIIGLNNFKEKKAKKLKILEIDNKKVREKQIKKIPDIVLERLNTIDQRIDSMSKRMAKIEEERNLEKELWHKIRANPPRKH